MSGFFYLTENFNNHETVLPSAYYSFFCLLTILSAEAQFKKYGTVYSSEKTRDTWSGTKKSNFVATLERNKKGQGPVSITLLIGNFENYNTIYQRILRQ
ncbi:MAG: hypothetical protein GY816_02120 [Cytophagales bacterium]|nr:hypothetical protein [Cytophagales bacterium]